MVDILLIFPPQWSPFQPALSVPSISAWLKRAGFKVLSLDLNLLFYEWLLSDECATMLASQVIASKHNQEAKKGYLAIFEKAASFREDVRHLQAAVPYETDYDYTKRNFLAVQSLETYLDAVSQVAATFKISPYEFRLSSGNLNVSDLEDQVEAPSPLIKRFLEAAIEQHVFPASPRVVGLSCIGQEQLYFTLLLGRCLKQVCRAPVIVGGTIFSRIFERGALPPRWFERYFDVIVRNEGEKPAERILMNLREGLSLTHDVPSIVYHDGGTLSSSLPCPPLTVSELPIPDFDDLPLRRYFSTEVTLPLLSARGCYWGKCEFCHHGMVYGEKYAPYKPAALLETVASLSARYGVRQFAFNDEALPPASARAIARLFPRHEESGWTFTGLIKFESSYTAEDFRGLYRTGFRSLYVGLESASERVLSLMRKTTKRQTIVSNLTDATESGIWMHCFLFFGFPGETDADARQTYDFILENSRIVSSFGAGTFALEHNAPIFHHYKDFGVRLATSGKDDVDVYYYYEVEQGLSAARAIEWQERLNIAARDFEVYRAAEWVPRDLLLSLLSRMTQQQFRSVGLAMRECGGMPPTTKVQEILTRVEEAPLKEHECMVLNRINGRVIIVKGPAVELFDLCYEGNLEVAVLQDSAPVLFNSVAFATDTL